MNIIVLLRNPYLKSIVFQQITLINRNKGLKGRELIEQDNLINYIKYRYDNKVFIRGFDQLMEIKKNVTGSEITKPYRVKIPFTIEEMFMSAIQNGNHHLVGHMIDTHNRTGISLHLPISEPIRFYLYSFEMMDLLLQSTLPKEKIHPVLSRFNSGKMDLENEGLKRVVQHLIDYKLQTSFPPEINSLDTLRWLLDSGVVAEHSLMSHFRYMLGKENIEGARLFANHPMSRPVLLNMSLQSYFTTFNLPLNSVKYLLEEFNPKIMPGGQLFEVIHENTVLEYLLDRIDVLHMTQFGGKRDLLCNWSLGSLTNPTIQIFERVRNTKQLECEILRFIINSIENNNIQLFKYLLEMERKRDDWHEIFKRIISNQNLEFAKYMITYYSEKLYDMDPFFIYNANITLGHKELEEYLKVLELASQYWTVESNPLISAFLKGSPIKVIQLILRLSPHIKSTTIEMNDHMWSMISYYSFEEFKFILQECKLKIVESTFKEVASSEEKYKYLWDNYPESRPSLPMSISRVDHSNIKVIEFLHQQLTPTHKYKWIDQSCFKKLCSDEQITYIVPNILRDNLVNPQRAFKYALDNRFCKAMEIIFPLIPTADKENTLISAFSDIYKSLFFTQKYNEAKSIYPIFTLLLKLKENVHLDVKSIQDKEYYQNILLKLISFGCIKMSNQFYLIYKEFK